MLETLNGYVTGGDEPMLNPAQAAQVFLNLSADESKVQLSVEEEKGGRSYRADLFYGG